MNLNKIEEMQRVLDKHRRELLEQERSKDMMKEAAAELKDMADALGQMAMRFEGVGDASFARYQQLLRNALSEISNKHGYSKKDLAIKIGVSDISIYQLTNHGYIRYPGTIFDRVENYLTDQGYDIQKMKEDAEFV